MKLFKITGWSWWCTTWGCCYWHWLSNRWSLAEFLHLKLSKGYLFTLLFFNNLHLKSCLVASLWRACWRLGLIICHQVSFWTGSTLFLTSILFPWLQPFLLQVYQTHFFVCNKLLIQVEPFWRGFWSYTLPINACVTKMNKECLSLQC